MREKKKKREKKDGENSDATVKVTKISKESALPGIWLQRASYPLSC